MDLLFSVPYLVRIVLSLVSILVFQKLLKRLDLAMVLGIIVLALWTGHSPSSILSVTADRVISLDMFFLAFVITGVIWLSSFMSEAGIMKDLVTSLKSRLSKRAILAALPAVVGLLPMPAGALFSAPLVDDADSENALGPDEKARIYGAFIEAKLEDGALLMEKVRVELDTFGIPAIILIVVIPFISGLTTGITVGYIGASFPVVLSLAAGAERGEFLSTMVLGYASGYVGMMLSPIHVCLIVTNEYFKTHLGHSLAGLLRPASLLFLCAIAYSIFWLWMG